MFNKIKDSWQKLGKGFRQFLVKTGLFMIFFIVISYLIGQGIVTSNLLYGFGIFIYGGMGYILLFTIFGFVLVYRKRLLKLKKYEYKSKDLLFIVASAIALIMFFVIEVNIGTIKESLFNTGLIHFIFLGMFVSLVLGIYGLDFIIGLFRDFKKEIIYFLIFGAISYALMYQVWKLWPLFSGIVTTSVEYMLKSISNNVYVKPPRTVYFEGFGAEIAEACSGVYSIFLFSALYLFIVFLDWNKLYKIRALILFIPAVIGAFIVNILRVFILFIVGAYLSREMALGLYHSYTGMIFFLIYFAIFWMVAYKWIRKEKLKEGIIKKTIKALRSDSLYRNSIYLMISTGIMAVLGFFFWIIAARVYTAEQVGLATTLISAMSLITGISGLGLGSGLIRFLPTSEIKNDKINTAFTLVALVTVIVSVVFLLGINIFSPKLTFVRDNIIESFIFIFFMVFASLASLIDNVFIAYRSAKYTLFRNTIFSLFKLGLPLLLVGFGAYGLFSSWTIAIAISFVYSLITLIFKFSYKPKVVFYDSVLRKIGKYSFGNYISGLIGGLPSMILPLMIISLLTAESSAYYYIVMMISVVLFIIPQSSANSLFAEGSYDESMLGEKVKKSIKMILFLLVPAIIGILIFGKYVLLVFGNDYSAEGTRLLQLFAISSVFISINSIYGSLMRVRKNIRGLIFVNTINALSILILSYVFIQSGRGLNGIGYAWIIGTALTSLTSVVFVLLSKKRAKKPKVSAV